MGYLPIQPSSQEPFKQVDFDLIQLQEFQKNGQQEREVGKMSSMVCVFVRVGVGVCECERVSERERGPEKCF